MAMTILIVCGEFDLSVGAIYAVVGIITGLLFQNFGLNLFLSATAAMGVALFLGYLNGLLITKTGMHSFIGTLATMMVFRGIAMVSTGGRPVSSLPKKPFFTIFGEGMIFDIVPVPILWLLAMCTFLFFILHKTSFGVKVFATGDNREAAELAGIDTITIKRYCFMLTAFSAGIVAFTSIGFLRTATPTQGQGLELEAIAAAVIGGTSMMGGVGSIFGSFLGALIMAQVRTGLVLMGTDAYVQDALVGLVIALAVIINVQLSKKNSV
jgi:ribose/xylose/arabinose/galactoside ABC-type transport system permease subunit